jgi:hypothetical protein
MDDPGRGRLVAVLDQAEAALRDVAGMLGTYREHLVAAGFDREDALELCLDVQRAVIFGDYEPPLD